MDATLTEPLAGPEPERRRTRRPVIWGVSIGAALVSMGLATRYRPPGAPPAPASSGITAADGAVRLEPGAPQWLFVKLAEVKEEGGGWTDSIPGRIAIDDTQASKVGSPLPGRVTRVFVELGQRVREGDPLFTLASADIAELRASREKAAVDLDAARVTLDRVRAMVANRALPAKEELSAQQQFREAEVQLKLAAAKLGSLRGSAEGDNGFTVASPRAGVVVEKTVLLGQQVGTDSGALFVVADLRSVWFLADVFEDQASAIREGQAARVTTLATPDQAWDGKVEMVSSVVDPVRHAVAVRVGLANPRGTLRPNLYARASFEIASASAPDLVISASALVSDGERQHVYVLEQPGRFVRRAVVTAAAHHGRVAVRSGLARGETVVEEGAILLDNQLALAQ